MRSRAALVLSVPAAVLALSAAGCGSSDATVDDPAIATPAASHTSAPTPTHTLVPGGTTTPLPTSTASASAAPQGDQTALLTGVAVGAHEGFTRVVFTFENAVPGYVVGYAQPPFQQSGSGKDVAVKGSSFVKVRMERAATADIGTQLRTTYAGPSHVPGTGVVAEVVKTGDFESVLTWVIGAKAQVPLRVFTLSAPSRLVIDLRAP